ncbi:MAG TPA: hypothetical protein VGG19_11775 [Tepidisphaeraceae bacterium]|jgi:hypothetical protein
MKAEKKTWGGEYLFILPPSAFIVGLSAFVLLFLIGCASPNKANITLRKQNAAQQKQIYTLARRNDVLTAQIAGMQQSATTLPSLPLSRLDLLFTAHELDINRLSAGADLNHDGHGQTGIRLFLSPLDDMGNPIQATGTYTIDAYDLAQAKDPHVGHWVITPLQCKEAWTLGFLRSAYFLFELPYQQIPRHAEITVHVEFSDELTGRIFTAQRVVEVQPVNAHLLKPLGSGGN